MELELHQLELRYEALRTQSARRERRLLASIADIGQQTPIVVVVAVEHDGGHNGGRYVVVDGYARVRVLRRLARDTVMATAWALSEAEALLLERMLRAGEGDSAIEQGWFLRELGERFGLGRDELARRFDRTESWVSRRIALITELPAAVQDHVRAGAICAHAAAKYLVPLARANRDDCVRLCDALSSAHPSSRQMAELYAAYVAGNTKSRELVVSDPMLVLRARAEAEATPDADKPPVEYVLDDLHIVGAVARRAQGRIRRGALDCTDGDERARVRAACSEAAADVESMRRRCERECDANDNRNRKEATDARREHAVGDSAAS